MTNGESPDERGIDVEERSCGRLDVARLRALFALEVRTAIHRLGPVVVVVTCGDGDTHLRVESHTWGIAERSIPGAVGGAEAERLLALAGAQLVFAVWLDAQAEAGTHRVDGAVRDTPGSAAPAAPAAPVPSSPRPQSALHVGVEAGGPRAARGAAALGTGAGL